MGFFSSKKDEIERLKNQLEMHTEKINQLNNDYAQQIQKNNDLRNQLQKASQISEDYNKLVSEHKKLKEYSLDLQKRISELQELENKYITLTSKETGKKCFTGSPVIYQKERKTSLETWISKLEKFISVRGNNLNYKKDVELATVKLNNCRKGLEGENFLKQNLLELRDKNSNFNDMIILQDLCFKSPFENDNGYRKNVQIDFLVITRFLIFIFDSKYRTGVETIGENSHITDNMQEYRKDIMEIISQSGLKEKFDIKESNIYAIMVYSGKNEINHAGFSVKSTDRNSGYCEECDEIKYIFNDNLADEIAGVYSHAGRKQKSIGFNELSLNDMCEISNSISDYICKNSYDFNTKCPLCGKDIVKRSGKYGDFLGCTGYKFGCSYIESI